MAKEIIVPAAGESVTEADISSWMKSDGERVTMDEEIVELETDKASLPLAAPVSGVLKILVKAGKTVKVGDIIGVIEEKAGTVAPASKAEKSEEKPAPKSASEPAAKPTTDKGDSYAKGHPSPAAAKAMAEKGIAGVQLQGSGRDGRITKQDVIQAPSPTKPTATSPIPKAAPSGSRQDRVEKMSRLRRTLSARLVEAQHTAALLTTFNEIDMSAVMDIRKRYKDAFKEKHQVNLGFMSFFTKATCIALQDWPIMNASVEGEDIVYHDYCDIGVAVATPKGLVVPVIRNAETMPFEDIEKTILGFAQKARDNKLTPDDMSGGTFTITNGGVFGSMLSTPIVNRPQSAILGMHNIVDRAVVVNGQVAVRPIMYVAVTYDHRIIDGADAVRFLVKIKNLIEDPTRLLIGL